MIAKIKKITISFAVAILSLTLFPATAAMADCSPGDADPVNAVTFFPAWYDGLYCSKSHDIVSPGNKDLGDDSGARFGTWLTIIGMNIVRLLLYIVGYVSLIFIIWGGFKYMINGDNSSGTVAARKTIQNAVIGLVLSVMSISIVTFIVSRIAS